MNNFTGLQQMALAKAKPADGARDQLAVGTHAFDFVVRVVGSLKVGEDYSSTRSQAVPWKQLAVYLLGKVNAATRDKVVRDFLEAHRSSPDGKVRVADEAMVEAAEAAAAELLEVTTTTCRGKVTGTPVFELVEDRTRGAA